jgi:7,8-dihydropterin-6-yl-methyl-4-(beta-D-ribofuranosyl)aminobenzene 5'-phosphate synthase
MLMSMVPPMGIIPTAAALVKITAIFNNLAYNIHLRTSWGFSCLVETARHTILFDAGGDGEVLLSNMRHLGVDLTTIHLAVVSHIHADHTGGLRDFLQLNSKVTTYLPESFPATFQQAIKSCGVDVKKVGAPMQLCGGVFSSGEMGEGIREQPLILDTAKYFLLPYLRRDICNPPIHLHWQRSFFFRFGAL